MTDNSLEIEKLLAEIDTLQRNTTEKSLLRTVQNMTARLRSFSETLTVFRQQCYTFAADMDVQLSKLTQGWSKVEIDTHDVAQRCARKLGWDVQDLQELCRSLYQVED